MFPGLYGASLGLSVFLGAYEKLKATLQVVVTNPVALAVPVLMGKDVVPSTICLCS